MKQQIVHISLVVDDYDDAIKFYTEKLNFILLEDTPQSETKRWVLVAPRVPLNVVYSLQKGLVMNSEAELAIKPGAGFSSF